MGLYKSRICKRSQNLWDEHVEIDATFGSFHSQARLGSVVDIIQLNCLCSTIGAHAMGSK
ncbi:hypothetical protein ES288_A10G285100v1 [Gossypium darwinii]|uniref:Uncharacterized protein n=1 Tax=Gossypium darwinii TaxID=34276 RepID=A0A5D2F509_GOSDA|nr:hypothetical protein ES288_A10G285100v1 [Gossypium darwinii]